jgi:deoxyribodipyrimidine photolyase-related protein
MNIFLIYPIHLFNNINILKNYDKIFIIEDPRFFCDYNYHKLKIAYHRATMKSYYNYLVKKNLNVEYIDFHDDILNFYKNIYLDKNTDKKTNSITIYNPNDDKLIKKLINIIPNLNIIETQNFLINKELILSNKDIFYKNFKYNHLNFYKWQRKRLNILIDKDGNPIGGKWSYDIENRKKIPNNLYIPPIINLDDESSNIIKEAKDYTNNYFPNNYGSLDNFIYPINHKESKKWLLFFIKSKFKNFGNYEDAETLRDPFLFHSILSPLMNIGLLTDKEVLNIILKFEMEIPLASFEGFIRQVIGWRNYVYAIYMLEGDNLSKPNFFNHHNKLDKKKMWEGKTGLLPIDLIINKINNYGYAHHIERLMYLGNYMLLCQIEPKDVFDIFMEWTIDAYEWVMMPNVYGMSQFSVGDLMMNRPYFSSSNYLLKMSDFKKGEWCDIFNSLYYNFISTHQEYLSKNYSTARQVAMWKKKTESEKNKILNQAQKYLNKN